jgi:gluconate 2-dehydrogenase gamma chain
MAPLYTLTSPRAPLEDPRAMARPNRREFVKQVTALGFGSYLAVAAGACRRREGAAPDAAPIAVGPLATFTPDAFRTLRAACERILPRDEDPGASDLGVPEYIDRMLAGPDLPQWRDVMQKLLPVLDRQAKKKFSNKLFHEASEAEQDQLLAAWQRGAGGERFFFGVLLALTFEGAFGDPKYGGNRGGRGYAMVGFTPGPPMPKMVMPR